jgi:hypothetical protein
VDVELDAFVLEQAALPARILWIGALRHLA